MFPIKSEKKREIILNHRDISIPASAFDIFWQQYVANNLIRPSPFEGPPHLIHVYRESQGVHDPNLIEYVIRCSWLLESGLTMVYGARRALIRFQITGINSQKIAFFVTMPEGLINSELSEEETEQIFDSFIDFLHKEELYARGDTPHPDTAAPGLIGDNESRTVIPSDGRLTKIQAIKLLQSHILKNGNNNNGKNIVNSLTAAFNAYQEKKLNDGRTKWGPKIISEHSNPIVSADTVSRCLDDWRNQGVLFIENVPLHPRDIKDDS